MKCCEQAEPEQKIANLVKKRELVPTGQNNQQKKKQLQDIIEVWVSVKHVNIVEFNLLYQRRQIWKEQQEMKKTESKRLWLGKDEHTWE